MTWQPIETAPRNGQTVLIYADLATVPMLRLAHWLSEEDAKIIHDKDYEPGYVGWWSFYLSCGSEKLPWEPTHWAVWEEPTP